MIYAQPSTSFEARVEGFATGLTGTIGVRVLDDAGATTTARATAGITENPAGSGSYIVTLTAPADAGGYTVFWDDGTVSPSTTASEQLTVTAASQVALATDNLYVTRAQLKATLSLGDATFADDDIDAALAAASRAIDRACGRWFYQAAADTSRYYHPDDPCLLDIDDIYTVTSIKTDPTGDGTFPYEWTLHTDYDLEPLNAAADGWQFTRIRRRSTGSYYLPTFVPRSVEVTGRFGWSAVPSGIVQATGILAKRLLTRSREAPLGVVAVGMDGNAVRIAKTDPDVAALIEPYVKDEVLVG